MFKFRLQRILNHKEDIEKQKKEIFGALTIKLTEEEDILQAIEEERFITIKKSNIEKSTGNIVKLKYYDNYLKMLKERIERQTDVIERLKVEVEIAKLDMLDAVKETKAFEKIKEKDYEKYLYEEKKNEEKLIDSIVTFNTSTRDED
ncbi:MAG: flagellar export protein FliJ [Tissierellia bacterium]|nr:flagellar export protein FliJ [Tissierellia bacterium]